MLKAAGFIDEAKECMAAARMDPDAVIHREALERDGLDFSRKPVDYFGKDAMSKAIYENLRSIARQANDIEAVIAKPQVELTTYHNSKGREARTVILVPDCSPSAQRYFERNMDYERRLTYVGMTRAKETVLVARQSSPTVIKELLYA